MLVGVVCWGMRTNSFIAEDIDGVSWEGGCKERCLYATHHHAIPHLKWESWVSENWPVLGALKRTTKGSLEKASTSPGWSSGYWYWPVTLTVPVLYTIRQTNYSLCSRWFNFGASSSVDTLFSSPVNKYILLLVWFRPAQSLTGHGVIHMVSVIAECRR